MINWAYIAGFFDGEGHIGLCGKSMRVNLTQKDPVVLRAIVAFLGKEGIKTTVRDASYKAQTLYRIEIQNRPGIQKFLRGVLPYIVVKKQPAEDYARYLILYPPLTPQQYGPLAKRK